MELETRLLVDLEQLYHKALASGKQGLSTGELLNVVLGGVEDSLPPVNLRTWAGLELGDLIQGLKLSVEQALRLWAALELGKRSVYEVVALRPRIQSSKTAFELLAMNLLDLQHEEFWVLVLNQANEVLLKKCISVGGLSGTVVDVKKIYKTVLQVPRAASLILAHNHPSGNLKASRADREITQKIQEGGKYLDIRILDHLIIGEQGYLSFAEEGYL